MSGISLKRKRAPGGGRPVGTGTYGEPTKVVRLPESIAIDVQGFVQKYQDLERLIYQTEEELRPRKELVRAKEAYALVDELLSIIKPKS